jgi:hypothetical protein
MGYFFRILALLGISLFNLSAARPNLVAPPLPSSFYGTVKVNTANVPDGTLIQALINGKVYAEKASQTVKADSMYLLNVPGDDPGTAEIEGGREGDQVIFKIGEAQADQTGAWKSGTILAVNLSASTVAPLAAPVSRPNSNLGQVGVIVGIVLVACVLFIILWLIFKRRLKGRDCSVKKEMQK